MRTLRSLFPLAAFLALAGCDETKHPGVTGTKLVLNVAVDLSGSVTDEQLLELTERAAWIVAQYDKGAHVMTHISWFAKKHGTIYKGESQAMDARAALETSLDRNGEGSKVPKAAFVGTFLAEYLESIRDRAKAEGASPNSSSSRPMAACRTRPVASGPSPPTWRSATWSS